MRAVWSFWSKPEHHRTVWPSQRYHLLAWVLSLQTARQHYPTTMLCTDTAGARLLIDTIGLEFGYVSTELDSLEQCDPGWWALGKLYAYRAQTDPFIHFDTDVFLWKRFPRRLECASVLAQNQEDFLVGSPSYYAPEIFDNLLHEFGGWLPEEWTWYALVGPRRRAANCGVFGGNNLDFIRYYAKTAINLLEDPRNQRGWAHLNNKTEHNILFEQYLLSACIEYHTDRPGSPFTDVSIQYLFNSSDNPFDSASAAKVGYTHLITGAKLNQAIADRIEARIIRDYPDYYERCIKYVRDSEQRVSPSCLPQSTELAITSSHGEDRPAHPRLSEPKTSIPAPSIKVPLPLVTAVMITGKSEGRNALAREAVRCFVEQTYRPRELLVLNEGEESLGVEAENIREIRIERVATRTLGDLRNLALEFASGDWVIQWDDDDWYGPQRIEEQMAARRPGGAVLLGDIVHYSLCRQSGFRTEWSSGFPGSILHERSTGARYPSLPRGEDVVFQNQFRDITVVRSKQPLYIYRQHTQNTWEEEHIMRSFTGNYNDVTLDEEEQRWLLWSVTPPALRPLLLAHGNCGMLPPTALQAVKASFGGLTFVVTIVDEEPRQLACCLENIREWHPDASIVVISDGGTHPQYKAATEGYLGRYVEGNRLRDVADGALWWERICIEALCESGNCILTMDPNSRVCRPFCSAPCGDLFGAVRSGGGAGNGHVGAACMGFSRKFAEKIVRSGVARRECCVEAKTLLVWDELENLIRSCVSDYSRLDGTVIRMAASLSVRWQSWSELGAYRGGHAWLNDGQQFAIIYP